MPVKVTDIRSNAEAQLDRAAQVIGRSEHKRKVFEAICFHKKIIKKVSEIANKTGLSPIQVLKVGRVLATNAIVKQTKIDG
jgi:hypothetical protein